MWPLSSTTINASGAASTKARYRSSPGSSAIDGRLAQRIGDCLEEPLPGEWLLHDGAAGRKRTTPHDELLRVAGRVDDRHSRPQLPRAAGELDPRESGHHDVRDEDVDARVGVGDR